MKYLSLTIGDQEITAPAVVPQGGLIEFLNIGSNVIGLIFLVAIILAFFVVIYGGLRWILSGGDKSKIQTARQTIVFAIIGLIVLFLSYFIVNIITSFFGFENVGSQTQFQDCSELFGVQFCRSNI